MTTPPRGAAPRLTIACVYDNGGEEIGLYAAGHHDVEEFREAAMVSAPDLGLDVDIVKEMLLREVRHEWWRDEEGSKDGLDVIFRPAKIGEPGAYEVTCWAFDLDGALAAPAAAPAATDGEQRPTCAVSLPGGPGALESPMPTESSGTGSRRIKVRPSPTADTRTCDWSKVSKETLYQSSVQHIGDIAAGMRFFASLLAEAARVHDHDKLSGIDHFHADFQTGFAQTGWWDNHRKVNRHHLTEADGIPADVNLIDVLDHVVDCVMAGMARSGSVRPLSLDPALLTRAFQNTVALLVANVEIDTSPAPVPPETPARGEPLSDALAMLETAHSKAHDWDVTTNCGAACRYPAAIEALRAVASSGSVPAAEILRLAEDWERLTEDLVAKNVTGEIMLKIMRARTAELRALVERSRGGR